MAEQEFRDEQFRSGYKADMEQINPQLDTLTSLSKAMAAQVQPKPKEKAPLTIGKAVKIIAAVGGAAAVIALVVALPSITDSSLAQSEANTVYCGDPETGEISTQPATAADEVFTQGGASVEIAAEDVTEGTISDITVPTEIVNENAPESSYVFVRADHLWVLANNESLSLTIEQLEYLYTGDSFVTLPCFENTTGESGTYTALIDIEGENDCKLFVGVEIGLDYPDTIAFKYAAIVDGLDCLFTVEDFLGEHGKNTFDKHSDETAMEQALDDYALIYG